jgi:SAM-dependent methyltransferase
MTTASPRPGGGSDVSGWFEPLYAAAGGDAAAVPWAKLEPHPYLMSWLDQPGLELAGVDAVVVGCGLGDDAVALARRGVRVTAFDVSATAIAWARQRFPDVAVDWHVADLFDLPSTLVGAFGLVVEVRTVQSLPQSHRDAAMLAVGSLVGPGGYLITTVLLATTDEAARTWSGPPWALAPSELAAYRAAGLERLALEHPRGADASGAMEVRLTYHRPASN